MTANDKTTVVFIAGAARSGSTILGETLGSAEGATHVGELHHLSLRGIDGGWLCGCGAAFCECPVWARITAEALGGFLNATAAGLGPLDAGINRRLLRPVRQWMAPGEFEARRDGLRRLIHAVRSALGARVIIDSSKHSVYGAILASLEDVEVYVLYLVRDPRAVAHSLLRRKALPTARKDAYMGRTRPLVSAARWWFRNILAERLARSVSTEPQKVRYEDFMAEPRRTTGKIFEAIGRPQLACAWDNDNTVRMPESHAIAGNVVRPRQPGPVTLRLDDAWKQEMSRRKRLVVESATWPLLLRYGYL